MRDDLIGYVLGALDSAEQQDIDRRLEQDVALRREVERTERLIRPLRCHGESSRTPSETSQPADGGDVGTGYAEGGRAGQFRRAVAPPAGLADRTCQALWDLTGPPRAVSAERQLPWPNTPQSRPEVSDLSAAPDRRRGKQDPDAGSLEFGSRNLTGGDRWRSGHDLVPRAGQGEVRSRERGFRDRLEFAGQARQWTLADFVVAAGVCVAAACLFFPALVNSRYSSQMFACQNNQRELGQRMNEYAMLTGQYPGASATDNTAVAGIYSVLLREKGLLDDTRRLVCPAKGNSAIVIRLPSRQELLSAQGPKLVTYLNTMGGDFAYTMGYLNQGRLQPVRNLGRKHMALLADAPIDNLRNVALTNHVNGQNVLFEDGHVRFLTTRIRPGGRGDDMFLNDHGQEWAGQHPEDVVLGRSGVSPFPAMHPEAALIRVKNGPVNPTPGGTAR